MLTLTWYQNKVIHRVSMRGDRISIEGQPQGFKRTGIEALQNTITAKLEAVGRRSKARGAGS